MNYSQTENTKKGPAKDEFGLVIGVILGLAIFIIADNAAWNIFTGIYGSTFTRNHAYYTDIVDLASSVNLLWLIVSPVISGITLWYLGIEFLGIIFQLPVAVVLAWYYLTFKVRDEWIPVGIVLAITVLYPLGRNMIGLSIFDAVPDIAIARSLFPALASGWIWYSWFVLIAAAIAGVFSRPRYA